MFVCVFVSFITFQLMESQKVMYQHERQEGLPCFHRILIYINVSNKRKQKGIFNKDQYRKKYREKNQSLKFEEDRLYKQIKERTNTSAKKWIP